MCIRLIFGEPQGRRSALAFRALEPKQTQMKLQKHGRPNFYLLQDFRNEASRIHYLVFDLLVYQDRDLTRLPRRQVFEKIRHLASPVMPFASLPDTHKLRWGDELTAER